MSDTPSTASSEEAPGGSIHDSVRKVAIGTCAWSYDDWKGVFYPDHLPSAKRLEFYAKHLSAVEVASTFYHVPKPHVVAQWDAVTPPHFRFSCKLTREITHDWRLCDARDSVFEFVQALEPLGRKLACILVQLPPSFTLKKDEDALRDFVRHLPSGARFAIEFRHTGWHLPRIAQLLQEHGVCWVWDDSTPVDHQREGAFEFLPDVADFLYVRLMGDLERKYDTQGGRLHRYRELQWPRDAALENWAVRISQNAPSHIGVFVAASNHFEGFAPQTCQRLGARLGMHISLPDLRPPPSEPSAERDFLDELFE